MGFEPFLVSASLQAVLAQRLARKICEQCKAEVVCYDVGFSRVHAMTRYCSRSIRRMSGGC